MNHSTLGEPVLSVEGLRIDTAGRTLVHDVGLTLHAGERLGLIGESGSGKSLTALAIMGLLDEELRANGTVRLAGEPTNLLASKEKHLARLRGSRLGMVFQEPMTALDPVMRVGHQVAEVFRIHRTRPDGRAARAATLELFEQVRLPEPERMFQAYPHQLSGGQRQRVLIAMALANDPAVLICDEPTSALDVTVQAQILELIHAATAERDTALLFITHDIAVVASICDRVAVMRDGAIVEAGTTRQILTRPGQAYTRTLVESASLQGVSAPNPAPASDPEPSPVVEVAGVSRSYRRPRVSLLAAPGSVEALDQVSLAIPAGGRFGIVGESGSGKSTLVRLIAGLDRPTTGSIRFAGQEISALPERRLRFVREDLQMVFQDPTGSLDPRMRVRDIIAEPLQALGHRDIPERTAELLADVGLPADAGDRYPHQFSGGQRQRISIARALGPRPRVLVADEPVSALDAPIRAQVLDLLARLVDEYALTLVFVSHDLSVVRHVCDTVLVLRAGRVVEAGPTGRVYGSPQSPYTQELLAAIPTIEKAIAAAAEPPAPGGDGR